MSEQFEEVERPLVSGRSKYKAMIDAVIATAKSGRAVRLPRTTAAKGWTTIRYAAKRKGLRLRSKGDGDSMFVWCEVPE